MVCGTGRNRSSGQHKCGCDGERWTTKKLCGAGWVCGGMVVIRDLTGNVRLSPRCETELRCSTCLHGKSAGEARVRRSWEGRGVRKTMQMLQSSRRRYVREVCSRQFEAAIRTHLQPQPIQVERSQFARGSQGQERDGIRQCFSRRGRAAGLGGAMELLGGGRWRVLDDVVLSGRKKKFS
jgi:hypothetical protein